MKDGSVRDILARRFPGKIIYAPNYWQWFAHHKNHGLLPDEIKHCQTQLDLIKYLGLPVFSRNIYCNEQEYWFGGLSEAVFDGIAENVKISYEHHDKIIQKEYRTNHGVLNEQLRYRFDQSTLVQEEHLINDPESQSAALADLVARRSWKFKKQYYGEVCAKVGDDGVVMAGEVYSPLKLLHLTLGPVAAVYFIADDRERAHEIMTEHEKAQLDLISQMVKSGVPAVISMDNLDTMFHPPAFVEEFCGSFYEKASSLCHEYNAAFFIHACGQQKDNLKLISALGVDGLEGVAYPPLGDIELEEAMALTGDRFIITGGISAIETRELITRQQVFQYVKQLFARMKPYANRFIFSASCNTAIDTSWDTLKNLRDAWQDYSEI